jgi:hypothetical protein
MSSGCCSGSQTGSFLRLESLSILARPGRELVQRHHAPQGHGRTASGQDGRTVKEVCDGEDGGAEAGVRVGNPEETGEGKDDASVR